MKKPKFQFMAAILTFLIGIVGIWVSGFLSSLMFSNTPQNFSPQIDPPLKDKPLLEQTIDNVEIHSDQLLNTEKDLGVFNPSGDYHPLNPPADKSEKFIQFDLQVKRNKGKLVAWGGVRGVQPWYKFTSVSVTEKHLKFSTAKIDGVNYDFNGRFLGKGDFASHSPGNGIVVLEGMLRKFVNGKKVMEVSTPFVYYAGC